ncbi:multiple cyclophane-containing RiPP AmcA [Micromonospora chersina]|uniref:multiple cyclophane-containing RiPP AmcA n=1 Tax=Micromonospora chersina TaxID=47854 RepID=UPI0037A4D818
MALNLLRHAPAGTTDTHRPSTPASAPAATGRATVSPPNPPLLTHVWQRVFAQRSGMGGQR